MLSTNHTSYTVRRAHDIIHVFVCLFACWTAGVVQHGAHTGTIISRFLTAQQLTGE